MNKNELYMDIALKLAQKSIGKTSPNPMVGAVIVKNKKIIARAFHKKAGQAHAEIEALRQAGKNAKNADLYVTLEPCCFFGKTPPCTDAIIKSGIKRVFIATKDVNPLNNCKGINILRRNNIKVVTGILESRSRRLNEIFEKYITTGMPFVILKMAQTLDGKIATKSGQSKWITCEKSRKYVHKLRRQVDAVMVGANTARIDKPRLKDSKMKIIVHSVKKNRKVDLRQLLKNLGKKQVTSILCEGGGKLAWSLLHENLVDKVLFFVSPKIIGGKNAITSIEGVGVRNLDDAIKLKHISINKIGDDVLIEGYPKERLSS